MAKKQFRNSSDLHNCIWPDSGDHNYRVLETFQTRHTVLAFFNYASEHENNLRDDDGNRFDPLISFIAMRYSSAPYSTVNTQQGTYLLFCQMAKIAPDPVNHPSDLKGTLSAPLHNCQQHPRPVCSPLFTPFFYTRAASSPFIPSLTSKAAFTLRGQKNQHFSTSNI